MHISSISNRGCWRDMRKQLRIVREQVAIPHTGMHAESYGSLVYSWKLRGATGVHVELHM